MVNFLYSIPEKASSYHLLLILGLIFEIIGAFFLATESIGLDRIRSWCEDSLRPAIEVMGESNILIQREKAESTGQTRLLNIFRFIPGFLGGALGILAIGYIGERVGRTVGALLAGLVAGLVAALIITGTPRILRKIVSLLTWTEQKAGEGSIGVIGFVVLFFGFLFQFFATVPLVIQP